mgnify:FL=1
MDSLSIKDRYKKSLEAGIDQYGGENDPSHIINLVKDGHVSEERVNESVRKILINKFELGLFDNPYVDEDIINERVNTTENIEAGIEAQRRSIVLLENNGVLPLKQDTKIFVDGLDKNIAAQFGTLVEKTKDADIVIMYIHTVFNLSLIHIS